MKRCKRCNKLLIDTAKFCTTCGAVCEDAAETDAAKPSAAEAPRAPKPDAQKAVPDNAAEAKAPAQKKRKSKKKKRRIGTLVLLIVALIIAAAIILVAARSCKRAKPASVPPAALADTQGAEDAAPAAPDASLTRIEVPTLTGLTLAEATQKLEDMGLVADVYETGYDPAYADGYVFTQDVAAGSTLSKGDHVALTANALPLSLTVLQTSVRAGRITLGNVVEICRSMGTTNPNFDYSIVIHAVEDYEIKGGFRCLVGSDEETPISRVNTQFLREGTLVNGLSSTVAYDDAIAWTFALEDWMSFHFENVTGYDVYLTNRVDTATAVAKSFAPDKVQSMALVDCPTNAGRIHVDIPTADALAIRITDAALPAGYENSPAGTGTSVPKWEVKLVVGSYLWISATVDGTNGEPQESMQATGRQFVQKGAQPTSFPGVSYTVNETVMVISVPIPADIGFDPYAISYLELNFGDGAYTDKIKIQ